MSDRDRRRGARANARAPHARARQRRLRLKLAILGSGTAIPHPRRGASGYALIAPSGEVLLIECGPGSTRRWPAFGITFERVRGIVVTHHHVDHCADLAPVMFGRNVPDPPVRTPLAMLGPVGHHALIDGLEGLYGSAVMDPLGMREVIELRDGDRRVVGPFTIDAREVLHVAGSLGLRVTCGGRVLAFSGDSGKCPELTALCRGAHVALLECSYPASRATTKHLNTRTAAETAVDAKLSRVVLTHFYPQCDDVDVAGEVRAAGYTGELVLAEDGLVLDV
ncbi:MBL fold metallo-hydrolase [Sandaracinus amylolyticus]|uniref:MBL fold metallo-hydrolase n=1 Tax=Sandaracinus amylolyticus TaxID=927083 RepID=UPI0023DDF3E4|nr:MBL fold metallo-hydrolase [Sandaracinus amylolyticus]